MSENKKVITSVNVTSTDIKCPGCGSQRAIHSLLNLDIKSAFGYNPLLVCTLPYIIMAFIK